LAAFLVEDGALLMMASKIVQVAISAAARRDAAGPLRTADARDRAVRAGGGSGAPWPRNHRCGKRTRSMRSPSAPAVGHCPTSGKSAPSAYHAIHLGQNRRPPSRLGVALKSRRCQHRVLHRPTRTRLRTVSHRLNIISRIPADPSRGPMASEEMLPVVCPPDYAERFWRDPPCTRRSGPSSGHSSQFHSA
jgi:hypothetical protein